MPRNVWPREGSYHHRCSNTRADTTCDGGKRATTRRHRTTRHHHGDRGSHYHLEWLRKHVKEETLQER